MRSFVIVVPHKAFDGATARAEREERADVEAFVVDGPEEAFDFAVGLRGIGADHVMANGECLADLLKPCQAVGMMRVAHGEREGVVREYRFDGVRQRLDDVLEEVGGRSAGLVGLNPDDGLAAEVVNGRELEVMPGVAKRRQVFPIDVEQLAWSTLFVPPTMGSRGTGELIEPVLHEHALDRAVTEVEQMRNPYRTIPTRAKRENPSPGVSSATRVGAG